MIIIVTSSRGVEPHLTVRVHGRDARSATTAALNAVAEHCKHYAHVCQLDRWYAYESTGDGTGMTLASEGEFHVRR